MGNDKLFIVYNTETIHDWLAYKYGYNRYNMPTNFRNTKPNQDWYIQFLK